MSTTDIILICVGSFFFLCCCLCCICCYPLSKKQHSSFEIEKERLEDGDCSFLNNKGYVLHYVKNISPNPRATLFLMHGLGEHVERNGYKDLYKRATERGISVFAMTHQGHGKSYGERGHMQSFGDYADEQIEFIKLMRETHKLDENPVFLMGHSLGSLVATDIFTKYPKFHALIISGCVWETGNHIRALDPILHSMGSCVPKLQVAKFDPNGVTRNQVALKVYIDDPLVHGIQRAGMASGFMKKIEELDPLLKDIKVPAILFHGGADPICLPVGSQMYHDKLGSEQTSLKIYEGMEHEPFEDELREEFFNDLFAFVEEQTKNSGARV